MWTLVWWVLPLAALGTFFLVGRSLWRSARALLRELSAAGGAASRFGDALAAAESAWAHAHPPVVPQLGDDVAVHRARLASLRAERGERRAVRQARHEETYRGWAEFNR